MSSTLVRLIAKTGYAARAVVYFIIGGLAVVAAIGSGGQTTDTKGALQELLDTGPGTTLLAVVAVGLLCYAIWRFIQGGLDTDNHGTDLKGLTVRAGLLVSAVTHTVLAVWAITVVLGGSGSSDGGSGGSGLAAWLMEQPFGPWLVGAVGLCIGGAGISHISKGVSGGYEKWFEAPESRMKIIRPVSTAGLIARGAVFLIVGGFFVYAGLTVDPQSAGGMKQALSWVRGLPFGSAIYFVIAIGLVCFACYSFIEALYRRINSQEPARQASKAKSAAT